MNSMKHKPYSLRVDLLIAAFVLIAGLKFTSGLENAVGVALYDESNYLDWGVKLRSRGFPPANWAPLYAIWYSFISLFEPDRINLYYLNYRLMTILPPILAYLLLRRNRVPIEISFLVSWFLLVFPANANDSPIVSHFALIVILSTFIAISRIQSLLWTSLFASIGALLASYVRPEYFLTYFLSSLLVIFACIREYKKLDRHYLGSFVAYGLLSGLLLAVLGLPLSGNRSMLAFGQHFSLNWVSWSDSSLNPWTNWQEIVSQNFGSAHSILEAFVENPSAFLRHIYFNLLGLVSMFFLAGFSNHLSYGQSI